MIAQELVRAGGAYVGKDGEVRHVYSISRPGNGYCVQWDSIPKPSRIAATMAWYTTQDERPHGIMQLRKFQKWAVGPYEAPAQEPGEQKGGA